MLNTNGERELVYVVTIDDIKPIEGRDRVECAVVGGWTVMVRKDQFKPGDLGIYFEIDSKVPAKEPFMFLEGKHFKIKTQKYKTPNGQFWSQGLLMTASDFGWTLAEDADGNKIINWGDKATNAMPYLFEGDFLTQELGVTYADPEDNSRKSKSSVDKYQKMAQRMGKKFAKQPYKWLMKHKLGRKILYLFFGNNKKDNIKAFPTHLPYIHKSDEERIENMPWILQNKTRWIKTTKIDGTSSLFLLERKGKKREYWVCSRNVRQLDRKQECYHKDNAYWEANDKYHIQDFLEDMLNKHPEWEYVALQGETAGCTSSGAKLQGDPHKFGELRFFGYNFITSDKGRWNSVEAAKLCSEYGIDWVPIVDDNYILPDNFEEFKLSADGPCEASGASGAREGYVYRNYDDNTLSFKNVSREYLLRH